MKFKERGGNMGNRIHEEEAFTRLLILGDAIKSIADAKKRNIDFYALDCDRRASCQYCPLANNEDEDSEQCPAMTVTGWIKWVQNYAKNFDIVFNPNRLEALEELEKVKKTAEEFYYNGPVYETDFIDSYSTLNEHIIKMEKLLK